jgi:hypothetical protein
MPNRRSSNQVVSRKLLDPSRLKVDYKARDAFPTRSRLRLGVHDKEIGDRPICDPRFLAANLPPARNLGREGPDLPEVAASLGLAQRRRANKRALHQSWQIARNLLDCSLTLNSGDGALHVDQRESARKARPRDRLGDGDLREEARSRAATLGRNLHAIQPQADPFRNNARRERGFLSLQALGYRGDHLVRKSPRDSDKRALGRSEPERESSWTFRRVRGFRHGLIRSGRLTQVYQSPMAPPTGSGYRDAETTRLDRRQPAHWARLRRRSANRQRRVDKGMVRRMSVLHKNCIACEWLERGKKGGPKATLLGRGITSVKRSPGRPSELVP